MVHFSAFLVVACAAVFAGVNAKDAEFSKYMLTFNKTYASPEEYQFRYNNWMESKFRLSTRAGATFGFTKFSDMSVEEFKAKNLGYTPMKNREEFLASAPVSREAEAAPKGVIDWRTKGAVTPVKNQAQCGSCWAFSATEEIESANILKTGKVEILSPQQITSCTTTAAGCGGGDTTLAYAYVKSFGGLESNKDYPYTSATGVTGKCKDDKADVAVQISGYSYATPGCTGACNKQDLTGLNNAMAKTGPVSICVYAESWQDYTGGILQGAANCPHDYDDLDHCVQLVGSNMDAPVPYWIIRNSWAADWGIDGYIYVAVKDNLCGVADEATFVQIA